MRSAPATRLFVGLLLVVLAGLIPAGLEAQADSALQLHFLNVGQGDATLIQLSNKGVLVDAGRGDDIVLLLQDLGVDTLVAAIAPRNHDDHIGGMDAALADWPVGRYLYNRLDAPNRNVEARPRLARDRHTPSVPCSHGPTP